MRETTQQQDTNGESGQNKAINKVNKLKEIIDTNKENSLNDVQVHSDRYLEALEAHIALQDHCQSTLNANQREEINRENLTFVRWKLEFEKELASLDPNDEYYNFHRATLIGHLNKNDLDRSRETDVNIQKALNRPHIGLEGSANELEELHRLSSRSNDVHSNNVMDSIQLERFIKEEIGTRFITDNAVPATDNTAPATDNAAPVTENIAPVTDNTAPVTENTESLTENTGSVSTDPSSLVEDFADPSQEMPSYMDPED